MTDIRHYDPTQSIIFRKTKDPFGEFSNFAHGFPLKIGEVTAKTVEALYQALKFPHHPEVQKEILDQSSPMAAKMKSRFHFARERQDWRQVNIKIMRWCLTVKLMQHWDSFGKVLAGSQEKFIVEHSEKDQFWGANEGDDGFFHGINCQGRLLMQLREKMKTEQFLTLDPLPIPDFLLFQKEIDCIKRIPNA